MRQRRYTILLFALIALPLVLALASCSPHETTQTIELQRIARIALEGVPDDPARWVHHPAGLGPDLKASHFSYSAAPTGLITVDIDQEGILRTLVCPGNSKVSASGLDEFCRDARQGRAWDPPEALRTEFARLGSVLWPNGDFQTATLTMFPSGGLNGLNAHVVAKRQVGGVPFEHEAYRLILRCPDGKLEGAFNDWRQDAPPPFPEDPLTPEQALAAFRSTGLDQFLGILSDQTHNITADQLNFVSETVGRRYVDLSRSGDIFRNPRIPKSTPICAAYVFNLDLKPKTLPGWWVYAEVWLDPMTGELLGGDYAMNKLVDK